MHFTQKELQTLASIARATGQDSVFARLSDHKADKYALVATPATKGVISSMCMRYRHDFGIIKEEEEGLFCSGITRKERDSLLERMQKVHAAITLGHRFTKQELLSLHRSAVVMDFTDLAEKLAEFLPLISVDGAFAELKPSAEVASAMANALWPDDKHHHIPTIHQIHEEAVYVGFYSPQRELAYTKLGTSSSMEDSLKALDDLHS